MVKKLMSLSFTAANLALVECKRVYRTFGETYLLKEMQGFVMSTNLATGLEFAVRLKEYFDELQQNYRVTIAPQRLSYEFQGDHSIWRSVVILNDEINFKFK